MFLNLSYNNLTFYRSFIWFIVDSLSIVMFSISILVMLFEDKMLFISGTMIQRLQSLHFVHIKIYTCIFTANYN